MSIFGALLQAKAANKAAKAQEAMGNRELQFYIDTRDQFRSDVSGIREAGALAGQAYASELGIGQAPAGYGGYTKTPGYDFRMNEGLNALQSSAAAKGGLYSGSVMKAMNKFAQDYGSADYGNFMSRLGGLADTGLSAAQMSGNASQNAAAGVSNALAGIGNAQSAGAIGVGNAINTGLQNGLGVWNYQKQMGGNNNFFNPLFGGKGLGGFV